MAGRPGVQIIFPLVLFLRCIQWRSCLCRHREFLLHDFKDVFRDILAGGRGTLSEFSLLSGESGMLSILESLVTFLQYSISEVKLHVPNPNGITSFLCRCMRHVAPRPSNMRALL